jgi:fructosamine-3-kinase
MDLGYLRAHPQHLPTFLTHQRIRETPVAGGSICLALRLTLEDGASVFAKTWPTPPGSREGGPAALGTPPEGFFEAEGAGLEWLAAAQGVPVPAVFAALPQLLALEWVEPGEPTRGAARRFGAGLAALHAAGAPAFGSPRPGYIGALPLDPTTATGPWPPWFAQARLAPYLRLSADNGALDSADVRAVERLLAGIDSYAGPPEPPARIHGDLWPGNLLWAAGPGVRDREDGDRTDGEVWLIDPAAQGGHRETDLATLALFGGAPYLDEILAGYQEVAPLADGWRDRVPLHQLHLLLVHTALFGGSYRPAVMSAVRATVDR